MSDGQLEYLEETPSLDGGGPLGRNVVWHDPANRRHAARGAVFPEDAEIVDKSWWLRHLFDQGSESSCTMQAAAGTLHTSPFRMVLERSNLLAYDEPHERFEGYKRAQAHDPWEGDDYDGSSTDAPFKLLALEGRIKAWRWNFGLRDTLLSLGHHGPCAIGTLWKSGMDVPRPGDALISDTGWDRGGHATLLYLTKRHASYEGGGYVDGINSWGEWGPRKGRFRMSWATLGRLLEQDGESVTIELQEDVHA